MKESLVSVAFQLHLFSHFEAVSRSVHVQHNPFSFPSKVESHFRSVLIKKKKTSKGALSEKCVHRDWSAY